VLSQKSTAPLPFGVRRADLASLPGASLTMQVEAMGGAARFDEFMAKVGDFWELVRHLLRLTVRQWSEMPDEEQWEHLVNKSGMTERQAKELAREINKLLGITREWRVTVMRPSPLLIHLPTSLCLGALNLGRLPCCGVCVWRGGVRERAPCHPGANVVCASAAFVMYPTDCARHPILPRLAAAAMWECHTHRVTLQSQLACVLCCVWACVDVAPAWRLCPSVLVSAQPLKVSETSCGVSRTLPCACSLVTPCGVCWVLWLVLGWIWCVWPCFHEGARNPFVNPLFVMCVANNHPGRWLGTSTADCSCPPYASASSRSR
jgi:hypothetical protein